MGTGQANASCHSFMKWGSLAALVSKGAQMQGCGLYRCSTLHGSLVPLKLCGGFAFLPLCLGYWMHVCIDLKSPSHF